MTAGSANEETAAGAGVPDLASYRRAPLPPRAMALLGRGDSLLADAVCAGDADAGERFRLAYIAAARGAAAVLAARPAPRRRGASRSAWVQLRSAVPAMAAWADYFADHSAARQAVEAGSTRCVDALLADEMVRVSREFLDVAEEFVSEAGEPQGAGGRAGRVGFVRAG